MRTALDPPPPARDATPLRLADEARATAGRLAVALERAHFAGYDPYDALSSPALRAVCRTPLMRRAAIQSLRRSPLNVRPLLGIRPRRHLKGIALLGSAYARLGQPDRAAELAAEVAERAVPAAGGAGWGYDFDVETRWGGYAAGQPNAVVTVFAAASLLDADSDSDLPRRALAFAESGLRVEGAGHFAYYAGSSLLIHNANLLVAGLFARCGEGGRESARAAVQATLERQRADGSWPYGEDAGLEWIDGFHTAYVLTSLADWHQHAPDGEAARPALERGLDLYLTRLIDADGAPRASLASRRPLDIHAASTAIGTLSRLRCYDERALPAAERVLAWTLGNMVRYDGRFAHRRGRLVRDATPYLRWNDAHMLLALATYLEGGEW